MGSQGPAGKRCGAALGKCERLAWPVLTFSFQGTPGNHEFTDHFRVCSATGSPTLVIQGAERRGHGRGKVQERWLPAKILCTLALAPRWGEKCNWSVCGGERGQCWVNPFMHRDMRRHYHGLLLLSVSRAAVLALGDLSG